jgi:hypothetical protein
MDARVGGVDLCTMVCVCLCTSRRFLLFPVARTCTTHTRWAPTAKLHTCVSPLQGKPEEVWGRLGVCKVYNPIVHALKMCGPGEYNDALCVGFTGELECDESKAMQVRY